MTTENRRVLSPVEAFPLRLTTGTVAPDVRLVGPFHLCHPSIFIEDMQ
jgi:hypothetical protein